MFPRYERLAVYQATNGLAALQGVTERLKLEMIVMSAARSIPEPAHRPSAPVLETRVDGRTHQTARL